MMLNPNPPKAPKAKKERAGLEIKEHAVRTLSSNNTFVKVFEINAEEKDNILSESTNFEISEDALESILANFRKVSV